MQLKKIKLSGFKSFVDPTTVVFPSQLVGVVGPNGCGKSNIIDAVRWVMGESSARHLRGDSLADVIFNGSAARKPVGHATIELIFDNSEGRLGGQYAKYSEIAIRRQLSRDGQSVYSLNGVRCRRRDITDIFLGTGLGPRSYAIIEQGTISRLIEAKPEELRAFLEEAAGISKYKERRRETENRIRDTKENLNRIGDIVAELEKRLQTLQRQAKTAERYKQAKQEERELRLQLLALRWRALDGEAHERERAIAAEENALEARVAELRALEAAVAKEHDAQVEANEIFNRVQGEYYRLGSEIARTEQAIQHAKEKREQNLRDLEEAQRAWHEARCHLEEDSAQIEALQGGLTADALELSGAEAVEGAAAQGLAEAEQAMGAWQGEWEQFNQQAAARVRQAEVERARIGHLEDHLQRLHDRLVRLEGEQQGLAAQTYEQEAASLNRQAAEVGAALEEMRRAQQSLNAAIHEQREANAAAARVLEAERARLHERHKEHASLEALQKAALGKLETGVAEWLAAHGLEGARRLAEDIQAEAGWERAVETVLGLDLEAVCVTGLEAVAAGIGSLQFGDLSVFDTASQAAPAGGTLGAPLLEKVSAPWSLASLLAGVYAVETPEEALALRRHLAPHESVITRDGVWFGRDWLRVARGTDEKSGVLAREQELRRIGRELSAAEAQVAALEQQREEGAARLKELEQEREALQTRLDAAAHQHAELRAQISSKGASLEQIQSRAARLREEVAELQGQAERDGAERAAARGRLEIAQAQVAAQERRRDDLAERRDALRRLLEQRQGEARRSRDAVRELALRVETTRTRVEALAAGLERVRNTLAHLERQRDDLAAAGAAGDAPLAALRRELEELLGERLASEARLGAARAAVEACDARLRGLNDGRTEVEQRIAERRGAVEAERMAWQEITVRRETIGEQIAEGGRRPAEVLETMPAEAQEAVWQERLTELGDKIQRMGPINLAAIEECDEQSQRKAYLDAQMADLNEALGTLENAIRRIDNESRTRFRETFEQVNERLGELYPKLFGGGVARLEMSSEDLLEAGVTVMARPPGKRNSTIHQLSGGEKALTAVALVFALFELNPAPFCMLDEVDAPLDDNNAVRFCRLVKEMSDRVQFIVITHNKITMEMANQLVGVTMHEPGVSRMVAVDVDQAVEMAAV